MLARRTLFFASAQAFLLTSLAFAVDIPIANPSFEDIPDPPDDQVHPPEWTWDITRAQTYPTGQFGTAPTPYGAIVAGINASGNADTGLSQTLTTLAAPNTTYTLSVAALNSNSDLPDPDGYPIKIRLVLLHADLTPLGGAAAPAFSDYVPHAAWTDYHWSFTTDGTEAGTQPLYIGLQTFADRVTLGTVFVDNFTLTASTQAPGTWQSAGSGDWNTASNWSDGVVPNGAGAPAGFLGVITSPQTVFTNTAVTVGAMTFDNASTYVIAGAGSLTVAVSSGSGSISVLQGSHKINLPLTFASNTDLTVASGASLTIGNPTTINANTTVTKSGNVLIQAPLTIQAGGALVLASGPTTAFGAPSLGSGAKIDVKSNAMTIDYSGQSSPAATIKAQLTSGYASGAWNGEGINSSSAVANQTALGWKDDAASQSILVKYTYYGDANLDGQVDISDLGALATAWQTSAVWSQGDFDYSGFVDISDLGKLATNWQLGVGSPLGPSFDEALTSVGLAGVSVPEPASLTVTMMLGIGGFLGRRRARRW